MDLCYGGEQIGVGAAQRHHEETAWKRTGLSSTVVGDFPGLCESLGAGEMAPFQVHKNTL